MKSPYPFKQNLFISDDSLSRRIVIGAYMIIR
jgi:hypothetical protein